jgi:D-xylose 1-dehydrogenase (NADP+, D-xylono-1,5-lactone-forming)
VGLDGSAAPLRLGLLSTAKINSAILDGAHDTSSVDVVAVASRDGAKARAYAAEHGLERSHGSYEALLEDEAVDAVYISLPNGLHHEWTMRSLAAGKHVLCEKPYSRHPDEVDEAFAAAAGAGLVLAEAFMYRHHPQTALVRDLVRSGRLGKLRLLRGTFSFALADHTNIRLAAGLDGGALMDVGCYCVSGLRLLGGEPARVSAEQVTAASGVDLCLYGTLRFDDDLVGQFDASFALPERQRLEAVGEEGTLVVEAPWRVDLGGRVLLDGVAVDVPDANSYQLELEDFAGAVAGEREPLLGHVDALQQARTIDALYRAAATGTIVTL